MAAALLSACMVGPDYRRPEIDIPSAWRVSDNEAAQITNIAWWDQFEDPVLSDLVRTALANNKDLGSRPPMWIRPPRNTESCVRRSFRK